MIARHTVTGAAEGARQGYRIARTELGEAVPPHAVDAALAAYRDEGRRLVAAARAAELVERALPATRSNLDSSRPKQAADAVGRLVGERRGRVASTGNFQPFDP